MISILMNIINSWSLEMIEIYKNLIEDELTVETEGIILLFELMVILCSEVMVKEKLFQTKLY